MVDFCGWEMPLQYKGIIQEHHAVRNKVGIFDVSHMGRLLLEGNDAERFLDYVSTNHIAGRENLSATYTVLCNASGGSVDDVIVYKRDSNHFFVIVNACNRQKDRDHLLNESSRFDVKITDRYQEDGILALQGPQAIPLIAELIPAATQLKKMRFMPIMMEGQEVILSRTGYTGSEGVEIYGSNGMIVELWAQLISRGQAYGIEPVGLGARDTLRLEMGYALYGHELSDTIAPTESVSAWTVKDDKSDFLGKQAFEDLEKSPDKRTAHGIVLLDKGIAREGYDVIKDGMTIGKVTSGTLSPTLNKAIALILVRGSLNVGNVVEVMIRNNPVKAQVINLPFYKEQR